MCQFVTICHDTMVNIYHLFFFCIFKDKLITALDSTQRYFISFAEYRKTVSNYISFLGPILFIHPAATTTKVFIINSAPL